MKINVELDYVINVLKNGYLPQKAKFIAERKIIHSGQICTFSYLLRFSQKWKFFFVFS